MKIRKIEIAILCGLLVAILAGCVSGFSAFAAQCGDIRGEVLRLHILANSNSRADQALKLKVRDKLLSESEKLFGRASSKAQAEAVVKKNLAAIRETAQEEVRREGYSYPIRVELTNMYFTTRTYGNLTMPAGRYDALRITIGSAQGHNWWCVMFPSLCLPSAETNDEALGTFSSGQQKIIKGSDRTNIKVEFWALETFEQAEDFFHNLFHSK